MAYTIKYPNDMNDAERREEIEEILRGNAYHFFSTSLISLYPQVSPTTLGQIKIGRA